MMARYGFPDQAGNQALMNAWSAADPANANELARNAEIAAIQGNVNRFIVETSALEISTAGGPIDDPLVDPLHAQRAALRLCKGLNLTDANGATRRDIITCASLRETLVPLAATVPCESSCQAKARELCTRLLEELGQISTPKYAIDGTGGVIALACYR
jgi:hypothetical protein